MLRRVLVGLLVGAAIFAIGGSGSTPETITTTTSSSDEIDREAVLPGEASAVNNPWLVEQQRQARQLLLDHHARLEKQRRLVEQNSLEHHQRVSEELGSRAPVETVPPMATIPPPVDE